jgi:hypothetical protein
MPIEAAPSHTSGPWEHMPLSDEVLGPRGQGVCSPCDCYDEEQWAIDAKLIAAAPDLLVALKAVVSSYDGLRDPRSGRFASTFLLAADAAIAKAEGRS